VTDALPAAALGFILQASYRILGGRAVVHLFGKLDTGQSFLVRDGRLSPYFWVRAADAAAAREAGATLEEEPAERMTLDGEPVVRVLVPRPPDTPALRDRLHARGIRSYEADVRFSQRYLIDHAIHGAMEIRGEPVPFREEGDHFPQILVYDDPHLSPSRFRPELSVLSLDIETDMRGERLLSVALAGCGAAEVLLLNPPGMHAPEGALPFPTERDLLAAFAHRVRELDPDVLTGWNVADFDLRVLVRRAEELGLPLELGRLAGAVKLRPGRGRSSAEATVPGRLVLDGIDLLTTSFVRMEDYSLDAVAREILGTGKTITGHDRGEEIQQAFEHDR
jgi:DNA polymerase II